MTEWRYKLRDHQKEAYKALGRFTVLIAHRRFGKTVFCVLTSIKHAIECPLPRARVGYFSPTYGQSKKVAWDYYQHYLAGTGTLFNQSELKCTLPNGATIQLGSAENPDATRGQYFDLVICDEPARWPPRMWSEVLRPALSDRKGSAIFIGTPQGRVGLLYDVWNNEEDWVRLMYRASETGIIDPEELAAARRMMSKSEYEQEWECSWDASVRGAFYASAIQDLERAGQITAVKHEPKLPVYCAFDLGINDATAVWFIQVVGNEYRFIDYQEYESTGLPDIVMDLKARHNGKYNYGAWIMPHDVNVQSLSTGLTRADTLRRMGVKVLEAPKLHVMDGIEETRSMLPRCWFDKENCFHGLEALRQYRSEYDEKQGVLKLRPVHDFTSHAADAMRYFAVTPKAAITDRWGGTLDYSQQNRAAI